MWENPETWVAIAFVIFVAAIFRPVSRMLLDALDARTQRIKRDLEEAERLREEAHDLLAEHQRKLRHASKETDELLEHAKDEARRLHEHAENDLEASLKRREQQALDRIAQAEAQAEREVRNLAVDVALAATGKLLSEKLDKSKGNALVDTAIEDLPKQLR
jgi:F-type H+-transporting ATPase subunit b